MGVRLGKQVAAAAALLPARLGRLAAAAAAAAAASGERKARASERKLVANNNIELNTQISSLRWRRRPASQLLLRPTARATTNDELFSF